MNRRPSHFHCAQPLYVVISLGLPRVLPYRVSVNVLSAMAFALAYVCIGLKQGKTVDGAKSRWCVLHIDDNLRGESL